MREDLQPEELLKIIFTYTAKIANEKCLDRLLMLMADMGRELIVADRCTLWLLDESNHQLWTRVAHGVKEIRIPADSGLVGSAIQSGEPIIIEDAYGDRRFNQTVDKQTGYRTKAVLVTPIRDNEGRIIGAYQAINKMTEAQVFSEKDLEYLTLASAYSGKSLESALLYQEIEETQKEIIFRMGEIGESRSKETGNHVKRVAEYSFLLANLYGMSPEEAELIKMASPMHDIGKVAIPDEILKKPGKLTEEEFEIMKTHTYIGYRLLKNSNRRILKAAAIIAYQHHEKWNGKGYPQGLSGEQIHLYGRITAVADVLDALASDRVYKRAWDFDRVIDLFKQERGEHFDPVLVDLLLDHTDEFLAIKEAYRDEVLEG
ncbi:HD domain-containing protein [Brevibacillus fluminis]|uniref:HD domain-containing protein n=1 Tax=Brevibacillus fluminis TaxID=511487 RepID=A0A3M8DNA9_9BACL|nr:HD domain-containing phosphohydrolase [Brevibacillus fluminis]RNB89582.1 HD domain-containing protein [Brevibacillus fluminis]